MVYDQCPSCGHFWSDAYLERRGRQAAMRRGKLAAAVAMIKGGATVRDTALECKVTEGTLYDWLRSDGTPVHRIKCVLSSRNAQIVAERAAGSSARSLAKKYGLHVNRVRFIIRQQRLAAGTPTVG